MLRDPSGTFWKPKVGGEKCVYRDRLKSGCWAKLVAKRYMVLDQEPPCECFGC